MGGVAVTAASFFNRCLCDLDLFARVLPVLESCPNIVYIQVDALQKKLLLYYYYYYNNNNNN